MADGALLGCPHCGKPIAFAQELAGRLAACPHCRGPFQMPTSPPASVQPPVQQVPVQTAAPTRKPPPNLDFDLDRMPPEPKPGERRGKEPLFYPNAEKASLLVCVCGIVVTLMLSGILILDFIVPLFQLPGMRTFFTGFLGSIGVLALLVGGIAGSLLLRHLVLVFVDSARNVRNRTTDG